MTKYRDLGWRRGPAFDPSSTDQDRLPKGGLRNGPCTPWSSEFSGLRDARSRLVPFRASILACIVAFLALKVGGAVSADAVAQTKTPVTDGRSGAFSFVFWGHPRGDADGARPYLFEETVRRIQELDPDFVVIGGDMIWGGINAVEPDPDVLRVDWGRLDEGLQALAVPVYRVPGNHDIHSFMTRDVYLERYPKPPYAFTFRNSRFILLDSVGIDQRSEDDSAYWGTLGLPLDESQIAFIRKEIDHQSAFDHIFLFMHHALWWEAEAPWWARVHPLLRNGKTRAVFSGDAFDLKYVHHAQDGIDYIQSSTAARPSVETLQHDVNRRAHAAQLDTFQHVRVDGEAVRIEAVVVGALSSDALSPRLWSEVLRGDHGFLDRLTARFHRHFDTFSRLGLLVVVGGGASFTVGVLSSVLWRRWHDNLKNRSSMAPALVRASRKVQIVLASGIRSPRPRPKERVQVSRSRK
jgi:Calcineurin-like phosphoesterase